MAISKSSSFADLLPAGMTLDDVYIMLAGAAAFFTVYAVGKSVFERDTLGPRLKALQQRREALRENLLSTGRRKRPSADKKRWIGVVADKLKLVHTSQKDKMELMLTQAGWNAREAIVTFSFFKFFTPIAFFLGGLLVADINWSNPLDSIGSLFIPIAGGYAGLMLPNLLVVNQRNKRWHAIRMGLSDALDLMMVCAEAGLTLSAAFGRVSNELGLAHPEIAEELELTSIEIGFLPEARSALENLQKRVDIQEIRSLVGVLIQTERYGTPVAKALRVLSKEFRTQRMLRAEQKAARLPAIMTIPMILFILPCLFIIVMTPAIIQMGDEWSKM